MRTLRTFLIGCLVSFSLPILAQTDYTLADTVLAHRLLKEVSGLWYNKGASTELDVAYAKADTARAIYQHLFGRENEFVIEAIRAKVNIRMSQAKLEGLIDTVEQILALRLKMYGEIHPLVADVYRGLGNIYEKQSLVSKNVMQARKKEVEILEKIKPTDELTLAEAYQRLALNYGRINETRKAIAYYEKALILRKTKLGEVHRLVIDSYLTLALWSGIDFDSENALTYLSKAQELIHKLSEKERFGVESSLYTQFYNIYYHRKDFDRAIEYMLLYKENYEKVAAKKNSSITNKFNEIDFLGQISNLYAEKGDMTKALSYGFAAAELVKKYPYPTLNIRVNAALSQTYAFNEDFDKALYYAQLVMDSCRVEPRILKYEMARYAGNLVRISLQAKDYDRSITLAKDIIPLLNQLNGGETIRNAEMYAVLGKSYAGRSMYDSALYYFEKELAFYTSASSGRNEIYASMCESEMAKIYFQQQEFEKADQLYARILVRNRFTGLQNLGRTTDLGLGSSLLQSKAEFERYWYLATGDKNHLQASAQTYQQAFEIIDYHFKLFATEGGKTHRKNKLQSLFEGAIATYLLLKDQNELIRLNELNKAGLLKQQLNEIAALSFADIPNILIEREKYLRLTITYLEKSRQERLSNGTDDIDSINLNLLARADSFRTLYTDLKKQFEKDYPDYYRLKYDYKTTPLSKIQQTLLGKDQTLLSYFVGDSVIYAFVVRPDTFAVFEFKKDFPLDNWVKLLRGGIYGYHTAETKTEKLYETTAEDFTTAAFQLYKRLMEPLSNLLTKEVIVVPDGVLNYVPFDVLLSEKPKDALKFDRHSYFGNKHIVSYNYSATLWQEMRDKRHKVEPSKNFIGFAPYYNGDTTLLSSLFSHDATMRKGLDSLKYSGEEVFKAQKLMQGDAVLDKKATKQAFENSVGDYRIVHLATHGKANDKVGDYSFLAFTAQKDGLQNELLYVRDIYNLRLNADLVVLSACETGIGELKRGEGVISLARAFAYAGAKSLVTTLWSVNDKSTLQIMEGFYRQLRKGASKNQALWQAKLDYRAQSKSDKAHPFFWAAFVPIGDMRPVKH